MLPAGVSTALPGLDKIVAAAGLATLAGQNSGNTTATGTALDLNAIIGLLSSQSGGFGIGTLLNLAGFAGNLGGALGVLQGLINQGGGAVIGLPGSNSGVPNVAGLLGLLGNNGQVLPAALGGLTGNAAIAGLLGNLLGTAQIVNTNFQGTNKDALMSLLKVAYAQIFAQIGAATP